MKGLKTLIATTCGALAILTASAVPARAALSFYFTDSNTNGNGNGTISYTASNPYVFSGTSGSYDSATDTTHVTLPANDSVAINPASASLTTGGLSMQTVDISTGGASTFVLYLSENGYTAPTGQQVSLTATVNLATSDAGDTAQLTGYEADGSALFATSSNTVSTATVTSDGTKTFNQTLTATGGPFTFGAPYSLYEVLTITFASAGKATLNVYGALNAFGPTATPEPGSMVLMGTVFCVLGLFLRRRMQGKLLA